MAKRFSDTEIWRRPWYRALSLPEREAWKYIVDTCDPVGVWVYDPEGAEQNIGQSVDWDSLPSKLHNNIEIISESKWWVRDFCFFQYGVLDPASKANVIQSYISLLKKHQLWGRYRDGIAMVSGPHKTRQEKEKEKDQDKNKSGEFQTETARFLTKTFPELARAADEAAGGLAQED